MAEIHFLNMQSISPKALLAQIAADDEVDGVVVCVRRNHSWATTWSSDLEPGALAMALLLLQHNVTVAVVHGHPEDELYDDPA